MKLVDLPDARRDKKPFLPEDDRDVTNGYVILEEGHPVCVLHGDMNRVHPYEPYWRCSEQYCGVGAELHKEED